MMHRVRSRLCVWVGLLAGTLAMTGCGKTWDPFPLWKSWLDPTQTIAAGDEAELLPILMAIDPMDEHRETVPNAEPPTPEDLTWTDEDYLLGPGDAVAVSILDLYAEGGETTLQRVISNEGFIKLPLIEGRIKLRGLSAEGARQAIVNAYRPDILLEPTVSVEILAKRQNTVNILGPVLRAGTYPIPRRDFRLLDALTASGDVTQIGIKYIYVFRKTAAVEKMRRGAGGTSSQPLTPGTLPPLPGTSNGTDSPDAIPPELRPFLPGGTTPTPPSGTSAGGTTPPGTTPPATQPTPPAGTDEDELKNLMPGSTPTPSTAPAKPVIVRASEMGSASADGASAAAPGDAAPATAPTGPYDPDDPFGWAQADMSNLARIIAINLEKLKEGDPRQNIVIRDGDTILVPTVKVGEFYVMGQVPRPGAYSLTGRQVTVKQALAAAGGMTALAWPSNSVLIRRIGSDRELRIPLDVGRIIAGEEPEILLKPDDVIAVGTHMAAPFLAVMRNAFRMTYGLGFIYDRNFAEKNFGQYNGIGESIRWFR